jgi:hypothetical protein
MWEAQSETLQPGCVRMRAQVGGRPLSYAEAIERWTDDERFRDWFAGLLVDAPFEAYCWETPAVTRSNLDRHFEWVLVDVPALARLRPDPESFAEPFARCESGDGVAAFSNLGGDAFLIAPLPLGAASRYSHLASFVRSAPRSQCHALWQTVGTAIEQHLGDAPLWVSSAGLGVSWLHVRLDTRPKYYRFAPYRAAA